MYAKPYARQAVAHARLLRSCSGTRHSSNGVLAICFLEDCPECFLGKTTRMGHKMITLFNRKPVPINNI